MSEDISPEMSADGLYREETYTDRKMGTITRLVAVDSQGNDDASRPVLYLGATQVMTPGGALPLNFEIDADGLEQAVAKFGSLAKTCMEETIEELQQLQRDQASSIVVPGQGGGIQVP